MGKPSLRNNFFDPFLVEFGPQTKDNFVSEVASLYKELIQNSFDFGKNLENVKTELTEEYSNNVEYITNLEKEVNLFITEEEKLNNVIRFNWIEFCKEKIRELEYAISVEDDLDEQIQAKVPSEFTAFWGGYKKVLVDSFLSLNKIMEMDTMNVELLRVGREEKSYILGFEAGLIKKIEEIA